MMTRLKHKIGEMRGAFGARGAILAYHRIAGVENDCYGLCVSPENFDEHLRVIRDQFHPMRLVDMLDALRRGELPDRAVCLTFDDGYVDNLHVAKPLLEQYGVPATVFVTSGRIGREREFWWDEIQGLFLGSGDLPDTLELVINGQAHSWKVEASCTATPEPKAWCLYDLEDLDNAPTPRHRVLAEVFSAIDPLLHEERIEVLDQLQSWASRGPTNRPIVRPEVRAMEPHEIVELVRGDLIDVGAHTVNHPNLCLLTEEQQRLEVIQGKEELERVLGRPIRTFAYPHGRYDETTLRILEDSGLDCACSCTPQEVRLDSPLMELPRRGAANWDGDRLAAELEHLVRPARTRLLERFRLA